MSDLDPRYLIWIPVAGCFLIGIWGVVERIQTLRQPKASPVPHKSPQATPERAILGAQRHGEPCRDMTCHVATETGIESFESDWIADLPTFAAVVETLPKRTCAMMSAEAGRN